MSLDSVIMDFAVLIIHIFSTRKLYLTIYSSKMKGKILHTPSLIVTLNKHQAVSPEIWAVDLDLLQAYCMLLGKSLNFSRPQFPYL